MTLQILTPIRLPDTHPVFPKLYKDIYAMELKELTDKNCTLSRRIHLTIDLPSINEENIKPDRVKQLKLAIKNYPLPSAPPHFTHTKPQNFAHQYRKAVKHPIKHDSDEIPTCIISIEPINKDDPYWACDTCNKPVAYKVFVLYTTLFGMVTCPYCRSPLTNTTTCYINGMSDTGIFRHVAEFNKLIEEYNCTARAYLAISKNTIA